MTLSQQLPGEIPSQINPQQNQAAQRGGLRILSLRCHVLLCPGMGVDRVCIEAKEDSGVPADKVQGPEQKEPIWEPSLLGLPGEKKQPSPCPCS